jgi:hypothetical protein
MLLIQLVSGMFRTFAALLLLPFAVIGGILVVVFTSPLRFFGTKMHEACCDWYLKSAYKLLSVVADTSI